MTNRSKRDFIPLLISILLAAISVGISFFIDYLLDYKHYVGFFLLSISIFLYFRKKNLYIYVFGITLLLGTVNLIDFFYINTIVGIGPIQLNPIFLTLFLLFLTLNMQRIEQMFPQKKPAEMDELKQKIKIESRIKSFEQKFQSKSKSELEAIVNKSNAYVNEARIAAERVLRKREKPNEPR